MSKKYPNMIFLRVVLILWGKKKLGAVLILWEEKKKLSKMHSLRWRGCQPHLHLRTHIFLEFSFHMQTYMEIWKYQMLGSGMNKKRDWGGSMTLVIIIFGNHNYCSNRPLPLSPRPSAEIAHFWAKPVSAHAQPCCQHCRQSNWRPEDSIEFHAVGLQNS